MNKVRRAKKQPSITTFWEGGVVWARTSIQAAPNGYLLSNCAIAGYLLLLLQRTGWHHPADGEGMAELCNLQGHGRVQAGRDLRRCLVQPPAQSRSARRPDQVAQGFIQSDLENLGGQRLCNLSGQFLAHLGSKTINITVVSPAGSSLCLCRNFLNIFCCVWREGMECSGRGWTLPKYLL